MGVVGDVNCSFQCGAVVQLQAHRLFDGIGGLFVNVNVLFQGAIGEDDGVLAAAVDIHLAFNRHVFKRHGAIANGCFNGQVFVNHNIFNGNAGIGNFHRVV